MTDYNFNKKILILSENKFSDKKSSIIFENLKKKGININLSNNINQNFDLYDFVFSNEKINYNKIYNFENIQDIIKVLLENENKLSKRMLILKDLYKDMDGIILACGPSLKDCNLKKLKEFKDAFEKSWQLAKNSDYWNAGVLNGIATTAILNSEPNLIMKLMENGALCATISGNGPSIMAITDKKNKSRVQKEFSGLDGKIMVANINNKKAYVHEL